MTLLEQLQLAQEFWEEYEDFSDAVKKKENEISQAKSNEKYLLENIEEKPGGSKVLIGVIGMVISLAAVIAVTVGFGVTFFVAVGDSFSEGFAEEIGMSGAMICLIYLIVFIIASLPILIPCLIGAIVSLVSIIKGKKINKTHREEAAKKYEVYKAELPGRLQVLNEELEVLKGQRDQYWKDHSHRLLFLPQKYRAEFLVEILLEIVEDCRADTLKEALNLCEQELRQRRAECAQRERDKEAEFYQMALLQELERQNDELERIRRNSDYEYWNNN